MANLSVYEYSDDDKIRIGKEICDLYREGVYTVVGCCGSKGIKVRTFYEWVKRFAQLADYFKLQKLLSDGEFDAKCKNLARDRMLRRLEGTDKIEVMRIEVNGKPKEFNPNNEDDKKDILHLLIESCQNDASVKITREYKTIPPSDSLLALVLSNVDEWSK